MCPPSFEDVENEYGFSAAEQFIEWLETEHIPCIPHSTLFETTGSVECIPKDYWSLIIGSSNENQELIQEFQQPTVDMSTVPIESSRSINSIMRSIWFPYGKEKAQWNNPQLYEITDKLKQLLKQRGYPLKDVKRMRISSSTRANVYHNICLASDAMLSIESLSNIQLY